MRKKVSFLLGSGFSIPAGLPGVKKLNERLSKIDESEFLIHSSMHTIWLNGQVDNNRQTNWLERLFVQDFIEFYELKMKREKKEFHYEDFYDYYSGYLYREENEAEIDAFYKDFVKKHKLKGQDDNCRKNMNEFDNAFNQLLASKLIMPRYLNDIGLDNFPFYGDFFPFLIHLVKVCDVKVHTLNHDVFFDWISSNLSGLSEHYCDGFQLEGSPYYSDLYQTFPIIGEENISVSYKVKLKRFVDKYDKPLSLYKLHGCVNTIKLFPRDQPVVRIKRAYGTSNFYIERIDSSNGETRFDFLFDQVHPDFLSGTTNKTRYYTQDPYYVNMLHHFQKNLEDSEVLFVIGYGFKDSGINDYLEKNFLERGGKMIVISPSKPETDLLDKYGSVHIPNSIIKVSYSEFLSHLSEDLKEVKVEKEASELPSLDELLPN